MDIRDESGATLAVVALALVAMLGMLALAVDGGALFLRRRGMVNAADAAALAAAQSFLVDEAQCGSNEGPAKAQADKLAAANVESARQVSFETDCDAQTVTVRYGASQQQAFSPVVGGSQERTVSAAATAAWGAAGAADKVAALMLSKGRLSSCDIPEGVSVGDTCSFWWNNSATPKPVDLSSAEWGIMNLTQWGVSPSANCSSGGTSFATWMEEGFPGVLRLNNPPPTYVCLDSGSRGNSIDKPIDDAIRDGEIRTLPVNDPDGQVDRSGSPCPAGSTGCSPDKYDIIGFAGLRLVGLYKGNSAQAGTFCPGHEPDPNARCLVASWQGFSTDGLVPGGGANFGKGSIGLRG